MGEAAGSRRRVRDAGGCSHCSLEATGGLLRVRYVRHDEDEHRVSWHPPTEPIGEYVRALLQRWPEATGEGDALSPWGDGPAGNGTGPLLYFGARWNMAEVVSAHAAHLAASMGLVCFDVSQGKVRS